MSQKVKYYGEEVAVLPEVADFLEQERKRSASQDRSNRRHLVFGDWDIPARGGTTLIAFLKRFGIGYATKNYARWWLH